MMPKIAIIIVTYNARAYLPDLVKSLAKLVYDFKAYRVVVVDNASTDETLAYWRAHYPRAYLLPQKINLGFAGGNNVGLRWARANGFDYAFLLNQDTIADPHCLRELVAVGERYPKAGAIQAKILLHPSTTHINSRGNAIHFLGYGYAMGYKEKNHRGVPDQRVAYASGAAVMLKMKIIKEIGFFDERFFMYHEDLDLGWRLLLRGYQSWLAAKAVVYHKYEFSRSIKKYYYMERNRHLTILQNYKRLTLLVILPAWLLMEVGSLFFAFRGGWWRSKLNAYAYFLSPKVWRVTWRIRRQRQKTRVVLDREIAPYFTGAILSQEIQNPLLVYVVNPLFNFYWSLLKKIMFW